MIARVVVAAFAAAWMTGCPRECESDADCPASEFCSTESHSCLVKGDAAAPEFAVTIASAPARPGSGQTRYTDADAAYATAYKRDEQAQVTITSTATDVASVSASVTIGSGPAKDLGTVESLPASECGGDPVAWCGKVLVNLWEPAMDAFREAFTVRVTGQDFRGSPGEASVTSNVTRWKWTYQASTTAPMPSPAIATDGTIYVGTGGAGMLAALNPDGTVKWEKTNLGALTASPVVGSGGVYVALKEALGPSLGASLKVVNAATGEPASDQCGPYPVGTINASPSLEQGAVESAFAVVDVSKKLIALRPGATAPACVESSDIVPMDNAGTPSAVVTRAGSVYFGDVNGSVRGFTFGGATGWAVKTGWPVSASLFTHALALVGSDVVGGGGPGQGGVFTLPESGGTIQWEHTTTVPAWSPAVDVNGAAIVGLNDDHLLRVQLGNSPTANTHATAGIVQSVPLIGADGTVYLGTLSEQLQARKSDMSLAWSVSGLGILESSPTLDCARDGSGAKLAARPGVLYVGSTVGALHAFVVDSRGIDTAAPWPKHQHDPRNTGNADTPMSEFACP